MPRQQGLWGDTGGVGAVLFQNHYGRDTTEPITPGVKRETQMLIDNYERYISIDEWNDVKGKLHTETVPAKRTNLTDYMGVCSGVPPAEDLPEGITAHGDMLDAAGADAEGRFEQKGQMQADLYARRANEPVTRVAGRMCMKPTAPPTTAPASDFSPAPGPTRAQATSPRLHVRVSPRAHFEQEDHGQAVTDSLKVCRIRENALRPHGRFSKGEAQPRVSDKEKTLYQPRDLRPARQLNINSKKRLNELLKLPAVRIEAGDLHPSRTYGIVPSQNLRVDHTL